MSSYRRFHRFVPRSSSSMPSMLIVSLLLASPALAQQAAPAQPATQPAAPTPSQPAPSQPAAAPDAGQAEVPPENTVSVTAKRSANRIDRQVYDVKTDTAASNDTVADTLNKVPSVAVDADGSVTLRGRSNVQIYVDGKPSAMMQGENRAAAISALPAADLESVEVINNPGAQFGNEGGGGPIINLVMRRERRAGSFGALNANAGAEGRFNSSGFGSYTAGKMSVQGALYARQDRRGSSGETRRERIDPASGAVARSSQESSGETENRIAGFNAGLTYNLNENDTLGANASFSQNASDADTRERYLGSAADGTVESDYLRSSQREGRNRNYSLGARLDHKGDAPGELLKLDLRLSGSRADSDADYATAYTVRPPRAQAADSRQDGLTETRLADITADYELPGEHGILKLGYKVAQNRNVFDNGYFDIDPITRAERVNAGRTNRFELDETTLALYGSYQWKINSEWGVLGGLRAEYTDVDMHQVTTDIRAGNHYLDAIPSAFVTYGWSDDTTLRLSYAKRIRRPGAGDLNPFVVYRDEWNVSSGNPNLRPSETDSLELGVETTLGKVETTARLYARRDTDLISERRFLLADDVLLTTRENAGSSRSGGLEFTFSGRPTEKLSINVSGNLGYAEQSVLGMAGGDKRTATTLSGRARIGYTFDRDNQLQLMLNAQGKTLFGEGYRQPVRTADLSYRRSLTPALSLVVNIHDLFDSQKTETITETERLREYSIRRTDGRIVYVGLSYRFGSFGAGQRGPGMRMGGPGMGMGMGPGR